MAKHGKRYLEAAKKVDSTKFYSVDEAMKLAKETSYANFDATIEVAYNLNVDPKQADQQIRGALVLPNGTGKSKKVVVSAFRRRSSRISRSDSDAFLLNTMGGLYSIPLCPDRRILSISSNPDRSM